MTAIFEEIRLEGKSDRKCLSPGPAATAGTPDPAHSSMMDIRLVRCQAGAALTRLHRGER
ncbi:hypothetical protein E1258_00340 [Micromonospora sp. KC207]|uniref:hypothetical protein n=1 Tax=Micromonospora sp. KC207 TaxID=2530377 RepID=UPI0010F18C74|nr:hypothetical protein [Micromonospora sp. KC207]TDC67373.1 hypothetical protein E1258_00340 [Micromonospora sp. KC207]